MFFHSFWSDNPIAGKIYSKSVIEKKKKKSMQEVHSLMSYPDNGNNLFSQKGQ